MRGVPDPSPRRLDRPPELAGMFDRAAAAYKARPGYPARVFEVLAGRCAVGPGSEVLEIGPGVGQATLPMLDLGARVTAVEPGAALAARLAERTLDRPTDILVSRFEDAVLPPASFDVVASATAFHWVDQEVGLRRAAQLLRDSGWLALWWTFWGDPDRPDPLHDALVLLLEAKAPHLVGDEASARAHIADVAARAAAVEAVDAFGPVEQETIRWEGHHDAREIRGIFATFSGWIALPEPLRTELLDALAALVGDRLGGRVTRPYKTVLYTAPRQPR